MQDNDERSAGLPLLRLFGIGFVLIFLIKIFLASVLDLYSDEVFYWQASVNPAIAYSDLPFMTALLVSLGNSFSPGSSLAVRLLFLILGSSLPLLVYWIAKPLTNSRQALESAALTLCLPLAGFLGLLAVPDVPLIFFGLLAIGSFERALRLNAMVYWLATGVFVAAGLSTHYRFALYPAAALLFLATFRGEYRQWRNPRLWLAMAIAAVGLIPILWFNLSNQLSSASFYFVERHPWEFQARGLLHIFEQAGLVTPPLYALLMLTAWLMLARARQHDRGAALMLSFAMVNISVYLVLAPWTDATSTSIHWPLSGYFPLLVFAPHSLRQFLSWASERWSARTARRLGYSIPVIGFAGTLMAFVGIGSQAFQLQLQPLVGTGILSTKMAGWKEFASHTESLLASYYPDATPVIVTDNYYTAAQVEFADLASDTLTLDRDKAVRDGRITQYRLWGKDESGLAQATGRPLLFINEDSTLFLQEKQELLGVMCQHIDSMEPLGELSLFAGDKRFSFYRARHVVDRSALESKRAMPCPFSAQAWIDFPSEQESLSDTASISGWAFNEDIGVDAVHLVIDGERVGKMDYGQSRQDVVDVMEVTSDPAAPNFGFTIELDTHDFSDGSHHLAIDIINRLGTVLRYGERLVVIDNGSG